MKRYYYILFFLLLTLSISAQTLDTIRYVRPGGAYTNDGRSWATAKNNVQDAINDLRDYMQQNGLTGGSVYIASGTYVPTESTESAGGTMLNTSFKIYDGMHVFGGFNDAAPESRPGERKMINGKTWDQNWASRVRYGPATDVQVSAMWDFQYQTILSGNHSAVSVKFQYDSIRGRYNTTYPASSYHVVWFATNGVIPVAKDSLANHYRPLRYKAWVDGCVIRDGNASTRTIAYRDHTSYGGGAYMVGNSELRHCKILYCSATMRGGGVYLDGGGRLEFCFVNTCQVLGVGIVQGYGGGVCIDYDGSVEHSFITQCSARIGAGLSICNVPGEYPWQERGDAEQVSDFSPFCNASLISNNTSSAEAGGVYLDDGGTLNHCSILRNNCIGPDVTYYGRRHGRSGGVYVRNNGMLFNNIIWGNACAANNDIQFASVRQNKLANDTVFLYHTGVMNHDITDWTNVSKDAVYSFEKANMPQSGSTGLYTAFESPTPLPGILCRRKVDGVYVDTYPNVYPDDYPHPRRWHPTIYSDLVDKGIQITDAVQNASIWILRSHTPYGIVGNTFEPVSTLGCLVRANENITYTLVAPQSWEAETESTPIPTLFVDPNRTALFDAEDNLIMSGHTGLSWDKPLKNIADAVLYFRMRMVRENGSTHYDLPTLDGEGNPTGGTTSYRYVQILVKEGTMTTAGPGNYIGEEMRTAAIRVLSHMRLYGGYPQDNTGVSTADRNPYKYVSRITADVSGSSGVNSYINNSAHVIAMINTDSAVVDGFRLNNGNAHFMGTTTPSMRAGACVIVNNFTVDKSQRINMVGNELRNCVLANNTSPKGGAIYVNGEYLKADDQVCYAELKLTNCVIRNNTASEDNNQSVAAGHGIITANGRAFVDVNHCTVVNNVGYPFKADNKATLDNFHLPYEGFLRVNNTLVFSNGDQVLDDRSGLGSVVNVTSVYPPYESNVFGTYNMFDTDIILHDPSAGGAVNRPYGFFDESYSPSIPAGFVPAGYDNSWTNTSLPADKHNQAIFTRTDRSAPTYPMFMNPSRNVGHSFDNDKPLYGGNVSYMPMNQNPCVNAADPDASYRHTAIDVDRSGVVTRDYGGAPDIGAIENINLPRNGAVIYVTPDGAGKRDGSSWSNAIAGNTIYAMYNAPAAGTDQLDDANGTTRIINTDPAIGTGADNGVLTTDNRYCGGFARRHELKMYKDTIQELLTTVENTEYVGGDNPRTEHGSPSAPIPTTTATDWHLDGTPPAGYYDPTLALDANYPYGELSGNSRAMYRAEGNVSPITESGEILVSGISTGSLNIAAKDNFVSSGQILVRNERKENYVSGLQYAVEQASILNKTLHKDSIQVWVGAGKYTDYKGYIMRDSVSVYGGFPTGKYASPGLNERRALMSDVVSIPKSIKNQDLDAADYETILQISDVNPKASNTEINTEVIKFYDDSASIKWQFETNIKDTLTRTTTHYYVWRLGDKDVSSDYMRYPDMLYSAPNTNVFSKRNGKKDNPEKNNYVSPNGGWTWELPEKYVYQYFGNQGGGNKSWELVYANRSNNVNYSNFRFDNPLNVVDGSGNVIGTAPRGMELTGGMSKMSAWQTMKNVPAGEYQLQIDLAAFYRQIGDGHGYDVDNEDTGVTFYILDATGDTVAEQAIFVKNTTTPYKLRRYTFDFTQSADGDLTVRLMAAPGTKTTDPATLNSAMPALNENLNRREVLMANVHLIKKGVGDYFHDRDEVVEVSSGSSKDVKVTKDENWDKKHRTTLRKRVLTMPDVTSPIYFSNLGDPTKRDGAGYIGTFSHYERVIKPERQSNVQENGSTLNGRHQDPNYQEYNNVYWDGFTIRHGFFYDQASEHGGGSGVAMYEGAHLLNCIVTDNFSGAQCVKGGGVFVDGSNATIENCFILNNTSTKGSNSNVIQDQEFAGGLFLYEGTCFNTLIANNYAHGPGGGLGLCVAKFYNNTLAYNHSAKGVGGLRIATGSVPAIFMANTIIYGNNGMAIDITNGTAKTAPFINCYIQSGTAISKDNFLSAIADPTILENDSCYGFGLNNKFFNGIAPNVDNSPFAADVVNGTYTKGAQTTNNFGLREKDGDNCINSGVEDFESAMYNAVTSYLKQKKHKSFTPSDGAIWSNTFYKNVVGVKLPDNDVVFADRIQDCQVDIGAYEYDAALSIRPDTITRPGRAIFYVAFNSPGGDASGRTPEDAACSMKLQKVLDAAGRYKYALMNEPRYDEVAATPVSGQPDKSWVVEVRLQGDSTHSTIDGDYDNAYTPTRSTKHDNGQIDNTLDYSFIIPHGVRVLGGYNDGYYIRDNEGYYLDADSVRIGKDNLTPAEMQQRVDARDPLMYRSIFSGKTSSITGVEGNTYHVVTFTNNLYDPLFEYTIDDGDQLSSLTNNKDRAVVDGLFIEDGFANSPDSVDRRGAAAVVTDYAHIRNCVIQNNEALTFGGGLYLKPRALVSGTIVKNNTANQGGGIYVEQPAESGSNTFAHVYTSTICENHANTTGGGLFFSDNVRVNSSVIWRNTANDFANLVGQYNFNGENTEGYPLTYTAVEVRQIEGTGNIEISAIENEGVRWDHNDPFDVMRYFPLNAASILATTGMTMEDYHNVMSRFPTLDSMDIAGVCRVDWDIPGVHRYTPWDDTLVIKHNEYIDIGARAINRNFENIKDENLIMYRIFVANASTAWNSQQELTAVRDALIRNQNIDDLSRMYGQRGSSFYYPFQSLSLAFDYIIDMRKAFPETLNNARFEVFVAGRGNTGSDANYTPERDAHNSKGKGRVNTFVIPERTSVIGSIDFNSAKKDDLRYCQAGYRDLYSTNDSRPELRTRLGGIVNPVVHTSSGLDVEMTNALTDTIRERRQLRDLNQNDVFEPWEFDQPTILSGEIRSDDGTLIGNAYHVITSYADSTELGALPTKYKTYEFRDGKFIFDNAITKKEEYYLECEPSRLARTIVLDGLTIQQGKALDIDSIDADSLGYLNKTYFRGGGIFVDGNWTKNFDSDTMGIPNVTDASLYNIPMLIRNCWFNQNIGGNGGAIYSNGNLHVYGSYFTQNYSQGPMSELDQERIPWSAGGCIATNGFCALLNNLFANNEAKRGKFSIVMDAESPDHIEDAEERQGFAGVVSASGTSQVNAMNCHFVRNKAVAYPAIFNFLNNSHYTYELKHYVFNSIFWGNEATGIDNCENSSSATSETKATFRTRYNQRKGDIMHYNSDDYNTYYRLMREYDDLAEDDPFSNEAEAKLQEIRNLANEIEGIYFSAYEDTTGLLPAQPRDDYLIKHTTASEVHTDGRSIPVQTFPGSTEISFQEIFTYLHGNHNVLISRDNNAIMGPHFVQPTAQAGNNDAVQQSDWLLSRINETTDAGWGFLKQRVSRDTIGWSNSADMQVEPEMYVSETLAQQAANDSIATGRWDGESAFPYPVYADLEESAFLPTSDIAIYNYYANRTSTAFRTLLMPLGPQRYMEYIRYDEANNRPMYRISPNPKFGVDEVYIDMGVYEYQYVNLSRAGGEVDTIWVTPDERGEHEDQTIEHDGSSWERATSNVQDAIDQLLCSYNNHDKYICFKEGTYTPITVINRRLAFLLKSSEQHMAIHLPSRARNDKDYSVRSITLLGGYSAESPDEDRNPEKHPVVFEMQDRLDRDILNQVFVVDDIKRQNIQRTFRAQDLNPTDTVIPVTFDGLTFHNVQSVADLDESWLTDLGGAAIFYREQRQYEKDGLGVWVRQEDKPLYADVVHRGDGTTIELPKLTVSNCIFADNGQHTNEYKYRPAAVYIGHGGGSSLVVNSLFHSNSGKPLYAPDPDNKALPAIAAVPNTVTVVNSTFALNDGHLTLDWDGSELHNSLIWMDDMGEGIAIPNDTIFEIGGEAWRKGIDKQGIANKITHNAMYGFMEADAFDNENLAADNSDLFEGPNFVDPKPDAETEEDRLARDFHINPAVRTMNMAYDTTVYRDRVFARQYRTEQYPLLDETEFWLRPAGHKYTIQWIHEDMDLAGRPRFLGNAMERGAYECPVLLRRVLYVDPTRMDGEGSSWQNAFGQNQLQNAIDAAAIYTYMNRTVPNIESRRSYVFVKGAANKIEPVIRTYAGVQIYGSIPSSLRDTVYYDPNDPDQGYTDEECKRFTNKINSIRNGIASPRITTSMLRGVQSTEVDNNFATDFVLDGFEINNGDLVCTKPAINLRDSRAVIRNCMIRGNKMDNVPVVSMSDGLLYNTLIYDNIAPTQVKVTDNGLVLNCTVVAANATDSTIDATDAQAESVVNTLALNQPLRSSGRLGTTAFSHQNDDYYGMFADNLRPTYTFPTSTLPSHLVAPRFPQIWYQLHNRSQAIGDGVRASWFMPVGTSANADNAEVNSLFSKYDSLVNFNYDRDVLGNPRLIGDNVDLGCFETWSVDGTITATAETNANYETNYGGHDYPHVGSVLYINKDAVLHVPYSATPQYRFTIDNPLQPAYMLLKDGASLYADGNYIRAEYVAVEKVFNNQRYSMTALPYNYTVANAVSEHYNATTDSLTITARRSDFSPYYYSGSDRAAYNYVFNTSDSWCWKPLTRDSVKANDGWLLDLGQTVAADTILFTGWTNQVDTWLYTEDGESKTVVLNQYDHRDNGMNGNGMNFTRLEDMGWNMRGMPFLVSDYATSPLEDGTYQMHIPHLLYKMSGSGDYLHENIDSHEQIFSQRSWIDGTLLTLGNAWFTQTADILPTETLKFKQPLFENKPVRAMRPLVLFANENGKGDIMEVIPDSTVAKTVNYRVGRDGIKWSNAKHPQVWIINNKNTIPISLLANAPVETDMQVGIIAPRNGEFTFSLPEPQAFEPYSAVWLTDTETNHIINLMRESYSCDITAGTDTKRFRLRIGGVPAGTPDKRTYIVFANKKTLYVRGLADGDSLRVYAANGQKITDITAAQSEYEIPLPQGMYAVSVNDYNTKVISQ